MFEIKASIYNNLHLITCTSTDQKILVNIDDLMNLRDSISNYLFDLDVAENELKLQGVEYD